MLSSMLQGGQSDYPHGQPSLQSHSAWTDQTRTYQSQGSGASALSSHPYSHSGEYTRHSQRLPSPPDSMEESKESKPPSLPGFKNLLSDLQKDEEQQRHQTAPTGQRRSSDSYPSGHNPSYGSAARGQFPPTPPLRPGSAFAPEKQSPPALASSFSSQTGYYQAPAINNMEPYNQRQITYSPITEKRPSVTTQGYSPFSSSLHGSPATSTGSYQISPVEATTNTGMLYQRALPTNFPATYAPHHHHQMLSSYPAIPTWQQQSHHHHFPPSSIPPYSQSPDRYLCNQCNKAFSRPSSLKIHMHSHTGEKPFKCGHPGCGKAFSVRSNMKRHEKGCHGDAPGVGQFVQTRSPGSI